MPEQAEEGDLLDAISKIVANEQIPSSIFDSHSHLVTFQAFTERNLEKMNTLLLTV